MRSPALRPGLLFALLSAEPTTNHRKDDTMSKAPDPANPNAAHFDKPYFLPRPAMRGQSQSQRIRASQTRLAAVKPAKVTLPRMPEGLLQE